MYIAMKKTNSVKGTEIKKMVIDEIGKSTFLMKEIMVYNFLYFIKMFLKINSYK